MELNLEEFTGLLFRDVKSNYDPNNIHRDKLFFSTDTKELLLNGESYGKNNLFVLNDIGLLSNESGQRIKEIIGPFKDVIQAITDRKVFITIMGVGITPVIVKQQSAKVSFTVFYYDTYNTSQIKHRTLIINSDGIEWTNIESIIDDEIIRISDLNLNYNRENKIISIKKENNDIITQIDATDFIKDGMINTVELIKNPDSKPVGTYLVITFNTDAGKEPIYLDITTLIGIYTAGQGIDISDNTISIKIDPSSEKYISVTKDGLKIVGIDEKLNFTTTTKINKLIGEIQITNELEHDKQEMFDLFGVTDVNGLFSLSPETTDKYFEDVEGNRLKYFISGGISGGTLTISYENVIYNDSILSDVILISASKDNYGLYNKIVSITNSKKESNITFYYIGNIFSLSTSSTSAEIEKVLGSVNDFTNAYENGKLIVCRANSGNNNDTISPILFQYYNDTIKLKMIYAGLGYNPSSPDDCIEIMLNKSSNTWRVTNVIKQKLNLPDNLAYVEEVTEENPSEQLEFIADKAIKDSNGNVIIKTYATKEELSLKTSEVYTNLSAIKASGETNKDKIYIDGETLKQYGYKDGKFVPLKGSEEKEHVFDDLYEVGARVYYACNGLIYYVNNKSRLCSFNERTFETKVVLDNYEIHVETETFNNPNPKCKRFIIRDNKCLTFGRSSGVSITLYDLDTREKIYDNYDHGFTYLDNKGFFVEFNGKIFIMSTAERLLKEIDFETGNIIKEHTIFQDINKNVDIGYDFFSYADEEVSIFVIFDTIVKYDIANDKFSLLSYTSVSSEIVNNSYGSAKGVYKSPFEGYLWIFHENGFCCNSLTGILAGRYDSTVYYSNPDAQRRNFLANYLQQLSDTVFISPYQKIEISMSSISSCIICVTANPNELGYITKGELGAVYNRSNYNANYRTLSIYRRYENDLH